MLKNVFETRRKAIFILPFVSIAKEKLKYLQVFSFIFNENHSNFNHTSFVSFFLKWLLEDNVVKADGFIGSMSPNGGFNSIDIAICTIEKANSLLNRLIEDEQFFELGLCTY
jgi:DNA polymerase theta